MVLAAYLILTHLYCKKGSIYSFPIAAYLREKALIRYAGDEDYFLLYLEHSHIL